MTALPSNLALVGEDLARATLARRPALAQAAARASRSRSSSPARRHGDRRGRQRLAVQRDADRAGRSVAGRRSGERRVCARRCGLGDRRPRTGRGRASRDHARNPGQAPLGSGDPSSARTLLSNLGRARRALRSVATSSGGVCLILSGFPPQCVPTLKSGSEIAWYIAPSASPTIIFGIVRDDVESVEAVTADDRSITARLANNAFYLELSDGQATRLVVHLADGSSDDVPLPACPCAK